jgi:TonB family protein
MSTTQIPPVQSSPPGPPSDVSDLYDPLHWERAYREMHDVPALLIQLQDDLSRSRMREAFWLSVIVHLTIVILIVNSGRLFDLVPRRAGILVNPADQQKELTYLELPPDEQKVTKRPDTNNLSDKDRIATSKIPQPDSKDLKKILESPRPGAPGRRGPVAPPAPQASPAPQQSTPAPEQAQAPPPQENTPQRPPDQGQVAKLNTPASESPQPGFGSPSLSAGSAIEQAARAALANRGAGGGGYGGDSGDYGLGQGRRASKAVGELDVLSDTMGVDFGPYLQRVLHDVRQNWYNLIPEVARAPIMKKGKVSIEFAILKNGKVAGLRYVSSSGDVALDRAAYGGITGSNPFPPLPAEFGGQYLALRFHFFYNPDSSDLK